ncbi:MAG: NTP transferase domain-containing protein [Planctomycetota bacterium]
MILAAGASERLGEPKLLARIGPRTVLEHLLEASLAAEPPLVVTGRHHAPIAEFVERLEAPVVLVHNAAWEAGRTGSVGAAVEHDPGRALLIAPCDVPLVPRCVFQALIEAWSIAGAPPQGWLAPLAPDREGTSRPGHPIVLGSALAERIRTSPADRPLRELRREARPLWTVDVESVAIHDDLDTAADLNALRARFLT